MILVTETEHLLKGTNVELMIEAAELISSLHKNIEEHYDKQVADESIALVGRIAMSEKTSDTAKEFAEEIDKMLDAFCDRKVGSK